ncbi:Alpha/Beta hydrolase protein [Xylaria telfairii]|nr:Alpha/Beta hydrolase protein [Xylaria telfairii]
MKRFAGEIFRRRKRPRIDSNSQETDQQHDTVPSLVSQSPLVAPFPDGVKVLHDCPDAIIDVCFVHGLTGNRESTWTARGQSAPWPKTLLPPKLGKARILTYGYDAYFLPKSVASTNRLIDHATNLLNDLTTDRACSLASTRPLVFVAHSMGGLVCKKAILLSRNNPEPHLRKIFDCTTGVAFMGTPHRGSWIADWAKLPASAIGLVKSTNKSVLEILGTDNQLLEDIQVGFWQMMREQRERGRQLEVTCFFEELPLLVSGPVVSKTSATLEGYNSLSIHANHRDMVRFASEDDNGFKRLLGELNRWKSLHRG